ncbi:MAG: KpsF/GutQ family sugar-phosphate isomerase, partial [Bryocella sp.]
MAETPQQLAETPRNSPAELVRIEAQALEELALRLDGEARETFDQMAYTIAAAVRSSHRVMVTGVGKSGLIGRKIAATLVSTGTPSHFVHPGDA